MTIQIKRHLTKEQYIKVFSNPVSGISCILPDIKCDICREYTFDIIKDIRYSKSMIIRALEFWLDQIFKLYLKVTRAYNPLEPTKDVGQEIMKQYVSMESKIEYVKTMPDTFLFSHRYIISYDVEKYTDAMKLQIKLLDQKYQKLLNFPFFQKGKMDPFSVLQAPYGIQFTVFPNEHPYIARQKILEVGKTKKGNTYVIKS